MPVDFMTKHKGRKLIDASVAYLTNSRNRVESDVAEVEVSALDINVMHLRSGATKLMVRVVRDEAPPAPAPPVPPAPPIPPPDDEPAPIPYGMHALYVDEPGAAPSGGQYVGGLPGPSGSYDEYYRVSGIKFDGDEYYEVYSEAQNSDAYSMYGD
jgi:hypothetical protein